MDKKIMALSFLLCIVIALTVTYIVFTQTSVDSTQDSLSSDSEVTDEALSQEIDDLFIDEDDEIEIGDMV